MATIKDVANKAGLTVGTVSRVINNRGYISEETKKKVFAVMKELNYQPNEVARSLSKQKSSIIGVIVPHIEHPYFAKMVSSIERAVSKEKYKIILCDSKEEKEKEIDYIEMFKGNRVAGVILCSGVDPKKFIDLNIPLVTIERDLEDCITSIECDNYHGGVLAAKHLYECGCKNVVHLSGIQNENMPADAREEGFASECEKHGVSHKEVKHEMGLYYKMDYHEYITRVLQEDKSIDGIFASSDLIAAQVIQVCSKLGIKIPEQKKLIGFDDVIVASLTTPTITSISQPVRDMAEYGVQTIIKAQNGEEVQTKVIFPVTLIKRDSTRVLS